MNDVLQFIDKMRNEIYDRVDAPLIRFQDRSKQLLLCNAIRYIDSLFENDVIGSRNISKRTADIIEFGFPALIGVHFPFESYTPNTLKLFEILKVNSYKLYSFEMKININLANLREYYFQAVSNSSWAHEDYLVALHITENPELMDEMRRLNNAFGIGVIRLDAEHFMQSEILFSAKEKESLDWDTINRLVDSNPDFKEFLEDLMEDIKVGKIKSKYDETYTEEEQLCQYALKCGILS